MTSQPTDTLDDFARTGQLMVPRGSRPPGPARALLGWLPREHAETLLGSQADGELSDAQRDRISQALAAVAERPAGIDQDGLISPLPDELADHVTRLEATPAGARMRAEGWEIAMVDLARVVAIAPSVFIDTAIERAAILDPGDLRGIAELTLPARHPRPIGELSPGDDVLPIHSQYHYLTKTYTITSPNLNLAVISNFDAPGPERRSPARWGTGSRSACRPRSSRWPASRAATCCGTGTTGPSACSAAGSPAFPPMSWTSPPPRTWHPPGRCPAAPGKATARRYCATTTTTSWPSRSSCPSRPAPS
jgi:hypothetical protein